MIGSFIISVSVNSVYAAPAVYSDAENESKYTFTEVIDEEGNSSYKIALRTALRASIQVVVVPDNYNGKTVTEIASNGFMSCTKLKKVVLPKSVKKIGKNAFINCKVLEKIALPGVEYIEDNAFSMCSSLNNVFIPKTVNYVGTTAFRNNSNRLYVQKSAAEVENEWSSAWANYHTGDVFYDSKVEDTVEYREILNGDTVVGVEITENTYLASNDDVVLYNAVKRDGDSGYLPILNVCTGAFSLSSLNSLTFRDIAQVDSEATGFEHKINILSNAFEAAFINEINFEVGIAFVHPNEVVNESGFDGESCTSDGNNNSQYIFKDSTVVSVILPENLQSIPKGMFYSCTALEEIKIFGQEYDGNNVLPSVDKIGDGAFSSCASLSNIYIPETVTELGNDVFYDWGYTLDQTIHIAQYEDEIAGIWGENWNQGIQNNCTVQYKPLSEVTLHYMDDENRVELLKLKVDRPMPELEIPEYVGHIFKGIYTEKDGNGIQFYTSNMEGVRDWDDSTENLYVNWNEVTCTLTLDDGTNKRQVDAIYGATVPAVAKPTLEGHEFKGYYLLDENGERKYYYDENMNGKKWDRTENATLKPDWKTIDYAITYVNITEEEKAQLPQSYTVYDGEVIIPQLQRKGYTFSWDIDRIPEHYLQDITITANWGIIQYDITYRVYIEGVEVKDIQNPNPEKFTVKDEIWLADLELTGHKFSWDKYHIPEGTDHDVTVYGTFEAREYDIRYEVDLKGLTNPNQNKYKYGELVEFVPLEKTGYTFEWIPNKIEIGNAEDKTITGVWTPIQYRIYYNTYYNMTHNNPDYYTIEDVENKDLVLSAPVHVAYECWWDNNIIPKGSTGNITVNASYQEKSLDRCYNAVTGNYEIWTKSQFFQLKDVPGYGSSCTYVLMADITNMVGFEQIARFDGTLDGNGHEVWVRVEYSESNKEPNLVGVIGRNYGLIKNLTINAKVSVFYEGTASISAGAFCAVNHSTGVIQNCKLTSRFNSPNFLFYVNNDNSYAGSYAGTNYGKVIGCRNGLGFRGTSNMGGIVGLNFGTISDCENSEMIDICYEDMNFCVGGIAAIQSSGTIYYCTYKGTIRLLSYDSEKYSDISKDHTIQMCAGIIVGYKLDGGLVGNGYSSKDGTNVVSSFELTVVKYGIFNAYKHDQGLYFKNAICGRED